VVDVRKGLVAGAAGVALLGGAGFIALASEDSSSDTETCASRGEYDQLTASMSTGSVSNLLDVDGWVSFTGDNSFRKSYRSCWAPGVEKIVIAYSNENGLSYDWWVTDVG
jgi:hypothetical protein